MNTASLAHRWDVDGEQIGATPEEQKFYSQDQARDEKGRWTSTGAGGATAADTTRVVTKAGPGAEDYIGQGKGRSGGERFCVTDANRIEQGVPPGTRERDKLDPHPSIFTARDQILPADVTFEMQDLAHDARVEDYGPRQGNCYEMAAKFVQDNPDWELVHATLYPRLGRFADKVFLHAFAQKDDVVFDGVAGKFLPKAGYYRHYSITDARTFTVGQAFKKMVQTRHWGAWDAAS